MHDVHMKLFNYIDQLLTLVFISFKPCVQVLITIIHDSTV